MEILKLLKPHPIIPVVALHHVKDAIPISKALRSGGIHIIEVTLRTPQALAIISKIREAFDDIIVGAGTILTISQLEAAQKAGAHFAVSPGFTKSLSEKAKALKFPFMPGVATPSEVMKAKDLGHQVLKFFPAEASGGLLMLKALGNVFPDVCFCPTGGIDRSNVRDYLALKNVISVGGTWLVTQNEVESQTWDAIEMMSKETLGSLEVVD